jgi:MFS family permease
VFVVLVVTAGLGFYNASVILSAAKNELGVSVSAVSGATAMFFGISGLTSFLVAKQMDQLDIRWFYAAGGVIGALALASLRYVESVAGLFVFFAVFGVGFALAGLVPSTTVVARWFNVRRSVALSIATTGLSVGGIAVTPFAKELIDQRSLAEAGPWLGLAWFFGVIPIALGLIRSDPGELGLRPDGDISDATVPATTRAGLPGATFAQARATRYFRFVAATYALVFMAQVGAIAQLVNLATERIDGDTAKAALSTLAFASVGGRLLGGVVVTKVATKPLTSILVLVQGVALVLIAFADDRASLILGAAVFGLSVGNLLMLQPLLLVEAFGVREYSQIYSYSQLFGTIGVAGGPLLLGVLRDLFDYRASFLIASFGNVVGFALLAMAGPVSRARTSWSSASSGAAVT